MGYLMQDMRFKNKEEWLVKKGKFPPQFETKVSAGRMTFGVRYGR